jgi:hypothetical protein
VVRQRSAKPLFGGSIPPRASILSNTYITQRFLLAAIWLLVDGELRLETAFFAGFEPNFELNVSAAIWADS